MLNKKSVCFYYFGYTFLDFTGSNRRRDGSVERESSICINRDDEGPGVQAG